MYCDTGSYSPQINGSDAQHDIILANIANIEIDHRWNSHG